MGFDQTPQAAKPSAGLSRRWLVAVSVALALVPGVVAAHPRWFTEKGPYWDPEWQRIFSLPVLLALLSGAVVVGLLAWGERITGDPLWPRPPFLQRLEPAAPAILGVQTAITMIFIASRLDLFVPNIELPHNALGVLIAGLTVVAAFAFITGVLTRIGAAMVVALFFLGFFFADWYEVVEQLLFVGIALYLVAVGRGVVRADGVNEEDRSAMTDRLLPHALMILRVSAGLTVLILAFTEKLINVDLGVAFLREYPEFNVARELGFTWFSDERFVYAAGIVEATAGIALISGYLTRVVILVIWLPFNLGIPFLPAEELIGHLPILSTMYVLLVRGTQGIPAVAADTERSPDQRPAGAMRR
ncbi:MAG: hypothetical protein M3R06_07275 [Chloroflexota bacterium]|nr:hypothetical protein [Chloroflexota bacterium]